MKYFRELNDLETCLIPLGAIVAILDALSTSWQELPPNRRESILDLALRELEKHESEFGNRFQILFNAIKEDTHEESTTRNKRKSVRKNKR